MGPQTWSRSCSKYNAHDGRTDRVRRTKKYRPCLLWLHYRQAKVECRCSQGMCLGQDLYAELFWIGALNGLQRWQRKEPFWPKPLLFITNCLLFCGKNKVF